MRSAVLAVAVTLAFWNVADAQTSSPGPTTPSLTPAQQANRDRVKTERDNCRAQARSQGLKGNAIRTAMMDCMKKVDPAVAKRMGCWQAAREKGVTGDDMKKSVRECVRGA